MRSTQGVLAIAMLALLVLTACARGEKTPQLMNIRSTTEEAERCQFMRPIRRRFLTRNADYILSAVVLALMMLYAIT